MPTAKIQRDDETIEVDTADIELPDGFSVMSDNVLRDEYVRKDYHKKEIDRVSERFQNAARDDIRDELKGDEDFIESILEEHGAPSEEVQALKAEKQKLEQELEKWQSTAETYQRRTKASTIKDAAREVGIEDRFLQAPDGQPSYLETIFADRLDETDDGFVVTDAEGNRLPAPSDSDRTYAQLIDVLQSDEYEHLRGDPEKESGPNYNGAKGGGAARKRSEMSVQDKIEYIEKHGRDKYKQLDD